MLKDLTELVGKYETSLKVDYHTYKEYERFRDFAADLIKMENFPYGRKEMELMMRFLDERKLRLYSEYNILEMILRRKTMDEIQDVEKRKGVWLTIDNFMGRKEGKTDLLFLYVARYGCEEAENDFKIMTKAYTNKIEPHFESLWYSIRKTKDKKEVAWLDKVRERHMQLTWGIHGFVIPELIKDIEEIREKHKLKEGQ